MKAFKIIFLIAFVSFSLRVSAQCQSYGPGATFTSAIGTSWVGRDVCLKGDLIVDSDFEIISSEIEINPAARIIITVGNKLIVKKAHLFASGGMWKGIAIQKDVETLPDALQMNDCIVEDAEYAFTFLPAQAKN